MFSQCVLPTDGSSNRNPPERRSHPLYFQDSTREDLTISHHDQSANLSYSKVDVKEEIREEDDKDGVMEESKCLKVHKDLYQDNMVGSFSDRNPPERCPRESTQEAHPYIQHDQSGNLRHNNIVVKEEYNEDEEYGVIKNLSEGHDMMEPSNNRNPTPRCPCPWYSQDSTQEDHNYTQHDQSGNSKVVVKEEIKEEDEEDGVMEESRFLKVHKDLYQDNVVESFSNRNPPEKCPRPLYFQDYIMEDHSYAQHDQSGSLRDYYIVVKEEYNEEYGVLSEGHEDMMEPPNNRSPAQRCPHPLYSRDSTQENHNIAHHDQGEDPINMKVEDDIEEAPVGNYQQYTEAAGMTRTFMKDIIPPEMSTEPAIEKTSKDPLTLSPACKIEDENATQDCAGENTMSFAMDSGHHCVHRPLNPSDSKQPRTVRDGARIQAEKMFSCPECGESFNSELRLSVHRRSHSGEEEIYPCSECGKCFLYKSELLRHHRSHTGEKPLSCPECGKRFNYKSKLAVHLRSHTGEKPYSCPKCGKCFSEKVHVSTHQRVHTGKKPRGKSNTQKSELAVHQRTHTGEKPYACPECGKRFSRKFNLSKHQKTHRTL